MNKSWLTDQKEDEQAKKGGQLKKENVAHLVLILSLVAVLACSIRWESSQTKLEIQIDRDTTSVDTTQQN